MSKRQDNREKYKTYDRRNSQKNKEFWENNDPRRIMNQKACPGCKANRSSEYFFTRKASSDGLSSRCKSCINAFRKENLQQKRLEVIKAYGGKCNCCGEKAERFLSIDHINNDGKQEHGRGLAFYYRIIKEGFPDRLTILCFNCNIGRALNGGVCPHKSV